MKRNLPKAFFLLLLSTFPISQNSRAQSITLEEIRGLIIKDWQRAKVYTTDYLAAMPADKYGFKPVDSIRTFAQQMLHLALANFFLMSNATDKESPAYAKVDLEHSQGAQLKDSVTYYVTQSYDFCINAIKELPVNKWGEKKQLFSFTDQRLGFMMKVYEHQEHHRSETIVYMRMAGVSIPPQR
jgi:uncharacterized damage-inducible protein DinB